MKKHLIAFAVMALAAGGAMAQANDTIAKVKASGSITMGVRDSSGALSYTLGDGKYAGYHVELCQRIIANLEKAAGKKLEVKYQPVTSQNRIPLVQNGTVDIECGSTTNNATRQKDVAFADTTFVEEVRIAVKASSGITVDCPAQWQERRHHHGHHLGADPAQERARQWHRLQGDLRQGPCRQLPAARVRPCRGLRDGRLRSWRATSPTPRTRPISRSSVKSCRSSRSPSCCARTTRPSRSWPTTR
jgi:ABC-type amino acid transport substrate-binding protein